MVLRTRGGVFDFYEYAVLTTEVHAVITPAVERKSTTKARLMVTFVSWLVFSYELVLRSVSQQIIVNC